MGNFKKRVIIATSPRYADPPIEEEDAMEILQQRITKAPSFSVEMLREKTFGVFESDLEFRLVHLAMSPLYSESFDANVALKSCLNNVYNAEAHSNKPPCIRLSTLWSFLADIGR